MSDIQNELAETKAHVRRLQKQLETAEEKAARERKANGELALLVHELRAQVAEANSETSAAEVEERSKLQAECHAHEDRWQRVLLLRSVVAERIHGRELNTVSYDRGYVEALRRLAIDFPDIFGASSRTPSPSVNMRDRVRVTTANGSYVGVVVGMRYDGRPLVRFDDGSPMSGSTIGVEDSERIELVSTPAQQPEDALARDCGAE